MSRKLFVLGVAGALSAMSLSALAAPSVDTVLVQGFDVEEMNLVFGVTDREDGKPDCTREGSFTYDLGSSSDVIDGDAVAVSLAEGATVGASVDGADCTLYALGFTDLDGEVNHGRVVSSFVHALKDIGRKGNGCLVKAISGSAYGKTAETDDAAATDPAPSPAEVTESMEVLLTTVVCHQATGADQEAELTDQTDEAASGKAEAPGQTKKAEKAEKGAKGKGKGKGKVETPSPEDTPTG